MRFRLATSLLLFTLLAACGGAGTGAPSTTQPGSTTPPVTAAPAGTVDCAGLKTAAQQLLGVQLMAQLSTPDTVEAIRDKSIGNFDPDAFLAAMTELHALDGHSSPLGDPKAAIEVYEKAATAAKALFATEPITQAAIDAFNTDNVGTVTAFLGHQVAIAGAMDEAGC